MACTEGNTLKHEVLDKIEEYLNAEHAQFTCSSFEEEFLRVKAEVAHAELTDARYRYWQHLKLHDCDTAAILTSQPTTMSELAV